MEQRTAGILMVGLLVTGTAWFAFGGGMSASAAALTVAYQISPGLASRVVQVAKGLGASPFDLAALINFESDGWNPAAVNPSSGAVGLIQFMPSTLKKMSQLSGQNWTSASVVQMSAVQQMDLVEFYLDLVAAGQWPGGRGSLATKQALYLAVFYPKARYWNAFQAFPKNVQNANPGVKVVNDYVRVIDSQRKADSPL